MLQGLSRYIKKRALDPLETYVPPVLLARAQLQGSAEVMSCAPSLFLEAYLAQKIEM